MISAFHAVDNGGNSAFHLSGRLAGYRHFQHIPTSMLQRQWEVKWYQYVQNSLLPDFVDQENGEDILQMRFSKKNIKNLKMKANNG
ncbi:unnamed protein product, partial [Vitis vinifera]